MKVTLTNQGTVAVPLASSQGDGFVASLEPGKPFVLDDTDITIATIGDNPPFLEDLRSSLSAVAEKLVELITFWREHTPQPKAGTQALVVSITATGSDVRVLQGDDRNQDHNMAKGETFLASSPNYIELRQLGV